MPAENMIKPRSILDLTRQKQAHKSFKVPVVSELGLVLRVMIEANHRIFWVASDINHLDFCKTSRELVNRCMGLEITRAWGIVNFLQRPSRCLAFSQLIRAQCFQPRNRFTVKSTRFAIPE